MLNGELKELKSFLADKSLVMCFGSRDNNLQPSVGRAFGVQITSEDEISFYVPVQMLTKHLVNFENNGQIALTVCKTNNYVTYQFKGEFVEQHSCKDEELAVINKTIAFYRELIIMMGGNEVGTQVDKLQLIPALAITFKVEEIFNQTPGPKAGKKI
ncbi:MAG: hypothetical protein JKX95_03200 [Bacteroidia bacterium]|nr:hypothetical protein [Bacteroidia bacterium]